MKNRPIKSYFSIGAAIGCIATLLVHVAIQAVGRGTAPTGWLSNVPYTIITSPTLVICRIFGWHDLFIEDPAAVVFRLLIICAVNAVLWGLLLSCIALAVRQYKLRHQIA